MAKLHHSFEFHSIAVLDSVETDLCRHLMFGNMNLWKRGWAALDFYREIIFFTRELYDIWFIMIPKSFEEDEGFSVETKIGFSTFYWVVRWIQPISNQLYGILGLLNS